jgi:hypothetical protein
MKCQWTSFLLFHATDLEVLSLLSKQKVIHIQAAYKCMHNVVAIVCYAMFDNFQTISERSQSIIFINSKESAVNLACDGCPLVVGYHPLTLQNLITEFLTLVLFLGWNH